MQSRHQIWRYILCLLLFVLMSYPLLAQEQVPNAQVPGYDPALLEELAQQNCVVPISSLGGQGHQISGVDADLTTQHPQSSSLPTLTLPDPEPTSSGLNDPGVAAILVVDSFDDTLGYNLSAAFNVMSQAEIDLAVSEGRITHGALVMNHINALLDLLGFKIASHNQDWLVWQQDETYIVVMKVDAVTYGPLEPPPPSQQPRPSTSTNVSNAIGAAMDKLRRYKVNGEEVERFVVNMSFAILPCTDVINFYNQGQTNSFDDYFANLPQPMTYDNLMPTVLQNTDPLRDLFSSVDDDRIQALVGVASAGNSALPFPFAPAIFPAVFSVSAQPAPLNLMSAVSMPATAYANAGEFVENGGWIQLVNPAGFYGPQMYADVYYLGTSFSGPALSTSLALELTQGVDIACIYDSGNTPHAAYAKNEEEQLVDPTTSGSTIEGLLQSGVWKNLNFQQERQTNC